MSDTERTGRPHLFVIRHGATEWSKNGRHTGITDLPLLPEGEDQARATAKLVAGREFALVLTSPLQRARHTCELVGLADQAEIDEDLREFDYGSYEGITTAKIRETVPGWTVWSHPCPGGETLEQAAARVDRVIDRARSRRWRRGRVRPRPHPPDPDRPLVRPRPDRGPPVRAPHRHALGAGLGARRPRRHPLELALGSSRRRKVRGQLSGRPLGCAGTTGPTEGGGVATETTATTSTETEGRKFGFWLFMVGVVIMLAGLLFGYDQGVIAGALEGIQNSFHVSSTMTEVITSWVTLGALFGALFAGYLADRLGRKPTILLAAALFVVGAMLEAFSPGTAVLVAGRLVVGFGVGVASVAAPLYAAEQAPTHLRGRFVSTYQLAITIGIFIAYSSTSSSPTATCGG